MQRWSRLFIPTLREVPNDAQGGYKPLLRAGFVRSLAPGVWAYLTLAERSLRKLEQIAREEMDRSGAQEVNYPASLPVKGEERLWRGLPHARTMASVAAGELRSYKQLPQVWFRLGGRYGADSRYSRLLEACSVDADAAAVTESHSHMRDLWNRILARCGVRGSAARAGAGATAFTMASAAGDTEVAFCEGCGYRELLDFASARPERLVQPDPEGDAPPEQFHTPGRKTIADVSEFTGLPAASQMKSLVVVAAGKTVLALVRGDHQASEAKLAAALGVGVSDLRAATADEIVKAFGAEPGSLGPVGAEMRIVADLALEGRRNMITGANLTDYHLRNVTPGRDFQCEFADIRRVTAGDTCSACNASIQTETAIEVGHCRPSAPNDAGLHVTAASGEEITPLTAESLLWLGRILAAAAEQGIDDAGMWLPPAIAPFTVILTTVNQADAQQRETAMRIAAECAIHGIDALYDDREDRAGVKFNDADLTGIPYRITLGKKLAEGAVEFTNRRTREKHDVLTENAVTELRRALEKA